MPLPADKGGLEEWFAKQFVIAFNQAQPLGPSVNVSELVKNEVDDFDFSIRCEIADSLELAELNPSSEGFGRVALRTGKLNVHEYARWIFLRICKKKEKRYGASAARVFVLLYSTYWQFLPSKSVMDCLRSIFVREKSLFAGIFVLLTNGDLRHVELIHPYAGGDVGSPSQYKHINLTNLRPGQSSWTLE